MASLVDVRQRAAGLRPEARVALLLTLALLVYGNAGSVFPHDTRERFLLWSNLGLMALLLAWALARARLTVADVGLDPKALPGSSFFGAALSGLAALPPLLFIGLAPLLAGPVQAPEVTDRTGGELAFFLLVRQPIGTALFEELSFRGVLYGAWRRAGDDRLATLATAGAFAAWHLVITSRTVAESGVVSSPPAVAAGVVVSLAGLFAGGLIFAYLRWHTRSIAAPVAAHWLIVAAITVAVWALA
jgi:membrane protease YdiL (CAAX protease family)